MANDYASQFEQARKNYREQLDTYRSSHKEEDLVKANEAYQAWLKHQQDFRQGCFWRYASCRVASPWSRTPKMMSPSEILPRELDLEDMRVKNRMTEDELRFAIQAAELSGRFFSRFDPETKKLRWYWCGNE